MVYGKDFMFEIKDIRVRNKLQAALAGKRPQKLSPRIGKIRERTVQGSHVWDALREAGLLRVSGRPVMVQVNATGTSREYRSIGPIWPNR